MQELLSCSEQDQVAMDHYCKNHPDRKSRRKCHHCGEYICSECEFTFLEKPFCSTKCFTRAILAALAGLLKIKPKTAAERRSSIFPHLKFRPFTLLFNLVVLVLFIFLYLAIHNLSREVRLLRTEQGPSIIDTGSISSQSINPELTEFPDAMVLSSTVDITGEAADSIIISLRVNGKIKAVTLPEDNKFLFKDIKLDYGSNEIVIYGLDVHGHSRILHKMTTTYGPPRLDYLAKDFTRADRKTKKIALTFDGGAGNGASEEILDYLHDKHVTCTIFLTGAYLKHYPDLVKRMVKDGHEIGNHTWDHPHLTTYTDNRRHDISKGVDKKKVQEELNKTAELFNKITGSKMQALWRAPYGEQNLTIRRWASELGYRQIGWTLGKGENLDTHDWVTDSTQALYQTPEEVMEKILNFGNGAPDGLSGGIVLMHLDTQRKDNQVHHILPALIDSLRERGYELVTVSDLFGF